MTGALRESVAGDFLFLASLERDCVIDKLAS